MITFQLKLEFYPKLSFNYDQLNFQLSLSINVELQLPTIAILVITIKQLKNKLRKNKSIMTTMKAVFYTVNLLLSCLQVNLWGEDYSILTSATKQLTGLNYCQEHGS